MSDARRRSARPLPDLHDLPDHGRHAILTLIQRNRRQLHRHNAVACGDEWTAGLLEGLFAAGGLRCRAEVNRVARIVSDDLIASAVTRRERGAGPA